MHRFLQIIFIFHCLVYMLRTLTVRHQERHIVNCIRHLVHSCRQVQLLKQLYRRPLPNDHKPPRTSLFYPASLHWCRCFWHHTNLYLSYPLLGISFRLVPTLLIRPAWETILAAGLDLNNCWTSHVLPPRQGGDTTGRA